MQNPSIGQNQEGFCFFLFAILKAEALVYFEENKGISS